MRIYIQKGILVEITRFLELKKTLHKLDYYLYTVYLINKGAIISKDNLINGVPLYSILLKKVYSGYKTVLDDLIELGIIKKVSNYSTCTNISNRFLVCDENKGEEFILCDIKNKKLLQKIENESTKERLFLQQFFNDDLDFDYKAAEEFILGLDKDTKYIYQLYINGWLTKSYAFTVNRKTDNRFHSLFTRTPKVLRKYITYRGEKLIGYDLKSSQVFFFAVVLKSIIEDDTDLMRSIKFYEYYNEDLEESIKSLSFDEEEISRFIEEVVNGDMYLYLSDFIDFEFDISKGKYFVEYIKKGKAQKEYFDAKRDLAKKCLLIVLNTKFGKESKLHKSFQRAFPNVYKILQLLKQYHDLSNLLQQIESHVLLDCVAKEIVEEDIVLFTIHDCFYTVESQKELLKEILSELIYKYTSLYNNISIN